MNTVAEPPLIDLEPIERHAAPAQLPALTSNSPAAMMVSLLDRGVSPEQVSQMMDLQERYERREAEKAYNVAFAAFKAEAVHIMRNRKVTDGPLKGKAYAELHAVVDAVTPALSRHGLSASWKLTKDEKDWLEVTCTLRHSLGHSEAVSMGGPPDIGGAKNAIQARASTKQYLERYTLKAICGVAEGGDDDDGRGGPKVREVPPELLQAARDAAMGGWKALAAFTKGLTADQRAQLTPESENLKAAAKEADAKGGAQ
jgi:hypothetical protein